MIILPNFETEKLDVKNCLKCNKVLTETNIFCYDCYKCNLNTLYKIIKNSYVQKDMYDNLKKLVKVNKKFIKLKESKDKFIITVDDTNYLIVEI